MDVFFTRFCLEPGQSLGFHKKKSQYIKRYLRLYSVTDELKKITKKKCLLGQIFLNQFD
jgi:hypothetical protein